MCLFATNLHRSFIIAETTHLFFDTSCITIKTRAFCEHPQLAPSVRSKNKNHHFTQNDVTCSEHHLFSIHGIAWCRSFGSANDLRSCNWLHSSVSHISGKKIVWGIQHIDKFYLARFQHFESFLLVSRSSHNSGMHSRSTHTSHAPAHRWTHAQLHSSHIDSSQHFDSRPHTRCFVWVHTHNVACFVVTLRWRNGICTYKYE